MSVFYKNFVSLCAKKDVSPSGAAKAIGLSNAAASGWKTGKTPSDLTLQKLAVFFSVPVSDLTGEAAAPVSPTGDEKTPASVSESGRPYVDLDTRMIWSPAPVSILAAQYDVPSPVLAEIVGCDTDRASLMVFGTEAPTDEELLRIAAAFCVTPDSLRRGWVPLTASQYVADGIARRKKDHSL